MIVTNLVVALMIVSQDYEPIRATPVDPKIDERGWLCMCSGGVETLYRKKSVTNFVYSTTIDCSKLITDCKIVGCKKSHTFEPGELLGEKVEEFFCHAPWWYCDEHDPRKYVIQGGVFCK